MSEEKLNLTQKLLNAQAKLKVPKNLYNKFGKYNYRSAESILEAVKPVNAENGLLLTITDEPVLIGDWHYIKATATISDGSDSIVVTAYARESLTKKGMDDSQITGTASSYARKYALNGLYLIDDTKDADTDEYKEQGNQNVAPPAPPATSAEIGNLKREILAFVDLMKERDESLEPQDKKNVTADKVNGILGITDFSQLTSDDVKQAVNKIKGWSK